MTEEEWLTAKYPEDMLVYLDSLQLRKCRLFASAACKRIAPLITTTGINFLEVAERFADSQAIESELIGVQAKEPDWSRSFGKSFDAGAAVACAARLPGRLRYNAYNKIFWLEGCLFAFWSAATATNDIPAEWHAQSNLIRDIFGNPFRPVSFASEWQTGTVVALAQTMYDEREFGNMPILADALQDAGCEEASILDHCRLPGPHVRGCWVVDLVLGKS